MAAAVRNREDRSDMVHQRNPIRPSEVEADRADRLYLLRSGNWRSWWRAVAGKVERIALRGHAQSSAGARPELRGQSNDVRH
jgi:hypothetical protein